jgi:hypothetical protein
MTHNFQYGGQSVDTENISWCQRSKEKCTNFP